MVERDRKVSFYSNKYGIQSSTDIRTSSERTKKVLISVVHFIFSFRLFSLMVCFRMSFIRKFAFSWSRIRGAFKKFFQKSCYTQTRTGTTFLFQTYASFKVKHLSMWYRHLSSPSPKKVGSSIRTNCYAPEITPGVPYWELVLGQILTAWAKPRLFE